VGIGRKGSHTKLMGDREREKGGEGKKLCTTWGKGNKKGRPL